MSKILQIGRNSQKHNSKKSPNTKSKKKKVKILHGRKFPQRQAKLRRSNVITIPIIGVLNTLLGVYINLAIVNCSKQFGSNTKR